MAKKSKRPKRTSQRKKSPTTSIKRIVFIALAIALIAAATTLLWLDNLVQKRFDSHQWELPARVYASPVELYQGRALSLSHLKQLLQYMHYRPEANASSPGSYTQQGNTITLHTRGFRDSDGGEVAQRIRLRIANNSIADRKSTRLNSSHVSISYAVFCLKKNTIRAN